MRYTLDPLVDPDDPGSTRLLVQLVGTERTRIALDADENPVGVSIDEVGGRERFGLSAIPDEAASAVNKLRKSMRLVIRSCDRLNAKDHGAMYADADGHESAESRLLAIAAHVLLALELELLEG